jgi:molybdate transport system ATP-binding protein
MPLTPRPAGEAIRVRIRARDVALALEYPAHTSFQNILRGAVERVDTLDTSLVDVRLNVGFPLRARVTVNARNQLALKPGQQVFALVKSFAISTVDRDNSHE